MAMGWGPPCQCEAKGGRNAHDRGLSAPYLRLLTHHYIRVVRVRRFPPLSRHHFILEAYEQASVVDPQPLNWPPKRSSCFSSFPGADKQTGKVEF